MKMLQGSCVLNLSDKTIIFSVGRCGSTTLGMLLSHLGYQCLFEPFKLKDVHDIKQAAEILDNSGNFSCYKTLYYQAEEEVYKELLQRSGKIIYLKRKNELQGGISRAIVNQTNSWHQHPDKCPELNLSIINHHIKECRKSDRLMEQFPEAMVVHYETLMGCNHLRKRLEVLGEICSFLGVSLVEDERISMLLSPALRVNPEEVYSKIPNIKQIEQRFGSPYLADFPLFL